ncbi:MAG: phosphatase PAP2 family protein [Deltaproteobacteria bacterium]|nr:phosphatase PAP2 family protein [Deltaproteobacteria bacterium]
MDAIMNFDIEVFRFINTGMTAPFLDTVMTFVTDKMNFLGAVIVAAALIWILGKRQDRIGLVVLVLLVISSDLVANAMKHYFMRLRPCHTIEGVRLLVGCGKAFSMPSSHAVNIFSAMAFLTARYRKFWPVFMAIALIVAYSRVYVGAHYPTDVMAGAVLGTVMALIFYSAERGYLRGRLVESLEALRKRRGGN